MSNIKFTPNASGVFTQIPRIKHQNLQLQREVLKNEIRTRRNTDFYKYTNTVRSPFLKFNNLKAII